MATPATGPSRPGVSVGPTSEFSLFFHVKPDQGEALRTALHDLQATPGYRPGDYGITISHPLVATASITIRSRA